MSKLMNNPKFSGLKAITLAASMGWLALGFAGQASAGVIDASASAFDATLNISVTPIVGPVVNVVLGPFVQSAAGANAADADVLLNANSPVATAAVLATTASTAFVPSAAGNANASASITDLDLVLAVINTSLSADLITSTAALVKDANQTVTATGTTTLVGAALSVLGNNFNLVAAPAPNTVVFNAGGIFVVLNEQVLNANGPVCTAPCTDNFFTSALHISFTNVAVLGLGTINGDIIIANSTVSLTKDVQAANVAEPATLMLFGLGLLGLCLLNRRRAVSGGTQA